MVGLPGTRRTDPPLPFRDVRRLVLVGPANGSGYQWPAIFTASAISFAIKLKNLLFLPLTPPAIFAYLCRITHARMHQGRSNIANIAKI